jgi:hypothetical protein
VLSSLSPIDDDFIKDQTQYTLYSTDQWLGSLTTMRNSSMYKINLAEAQILEVIGELEDPFTSTFTFSSGWNWIGYIPHVSMSVNQAMSERTNMTGDFIKNQSGYAFYVDEDTGWIGSLRFMNPGEGFMLYANAGGSFNYPEYDIRYDDDYPELEPLVLRDAPDWSVNPQDYEYTASVTIELVGASHGNYMIGAFAGEECRGSITSIDIGGRWLYFLTVFSNTQNQEIDIKVYDANADEIIDPENTFTFNNDAIIGSPGNPYEIQILGTLNPPQNVTIRIIAGEVQISWDAVSGANSYKIYASDVPGGTFADVSNTGVFDNNRWTAAATEERRFYYVKASTEPTGRSVAKQGFSNESRRERRK